MLEWINDYGPFSPEAVFLDGVDRNFTLCGTG